MAIFTGIVRRYVVGRLARRFRPVMATEAVPGNAAVVERRIGKVICVVAGLTLVAGLRVVDRFANSLHAIVAGCTGFGNTRVIEPRDRPFSGSVAAFAFGLRNHMVARLARCSDIIVATGASFGSAGKYTALVAGIASDFRVRPGERKASRKMVEFFLGGSRRRKADGKPCRHQNCEK